MKRSDYLKTWPGQYYEYCKRGLDLLYLSVEQEPKSKKGHRLSDKKNFRKQVKEQLKGLNRRAFRGNIILQLDFYTTQDNPPALHTLSKNYLDLLHKPMSNLDDYRGILFRDDSQVKILIANRYTKTGKNSYPKIYIKAYRLSHFIEDISFANRVVNKEFLDDENELVSFRNKYVDDYDCPDFENNGGLEQLKELENNDGMYKKALGERGFSAMRAMHLRQAQEEFLRLNKITIPELISLYQSLFSSNKHYSSISTFQKLWELSSKMVSVSINQIELGEAPIKEGQTNGFIENLNCKLVDFKERFQILFPLLQPISITVFYTPPKLNVLDLDNLARRIIPHLIMEFSPPEDFLSAYYSSIGEQFESEDDVYQKYEKNGVSSYQIVHLPRKHDTPEGGSVDFCIADGMLKDNNIWKTVEDCISEFQSKCF